jgi:hypothetical protein
LNGKNGSDPRTVPGNQEAIAEMVAKNPELETWEFRYNLEDWLHPETKEARAAERQRQIEQERKGREEMRRMRKRNGFWKCKD